MSNPIQPQPNQGFIPGQQQQSHPTVPYGLPGGPPATVLPSGNAPQQVQQFQQLPQGLPPQQSNYPQQTTASQIPAYVPQQNATFPQGMNGSFQQGQQQPPQQSNYPQQTAQQPQFQPQFQPRGAVPALNANAILDGEGIPPELRGRTVGQAMQIYGALSQEWLQRQGGAPNGGQAAQQQRQAPPQQPNGQRPPQGQPPRADQTTDETREFWQNPAQFIRNVVQEVNQPILQQSQAQSIAQARAIAAQGIPDFQQLEGDIMQTLAGADPVTLQNPVVWQGAADLARGRRARGGNQQPSQFANRSFQSGPGVSQPANMAPVPPAYGFFTEGPTPPNAQAATGTLSPEQQYYARRMQMSDADYLAWSSAAVRREG